MYQMPKPIKPSDLEDGGFAREPKPNPFEILDREFKARGDGQYTFDLKPVGIGFTVQRIHRKSQETWAELAVTVNGNFLKAKHTRGILTKGNFNFSSTQARSTLGKALKERSGVDLDWEGLLTDLAIHVLEAERQGAPAVVLADQVNEPEDRQSWDVCDLPILRSLPMVLFGDGGSMKSYIAMFVAGTLAEQGINVGYFDWEYAMKPHRARLGRLFAPMPKNLIYVRCDKPMKDETERLQRVIAEHQLQYVICDSMVFALDGKADEEQAGIYFRSVRQFGEIGSLHVAHTAKTEGETDKTIFGSVFFSNGARSIWHVAKAVEHLPGEEYIGMFHRKANEGQALKPRGFKFTFRKDRVSVEPLDVSTVDELAAKLPILDRIKKLLSKGALLPKDIGNRLGVGVPYVLAVIAKHESVFSRIGQKVGLASQDVEF